MIQVDKLGVRIQQKEILRDITLQIGKGEFIGLIGPNGSGKSTLLKSLANLLKTTSGKVLIGGENIQLFKPKQLAELVSYVPQDTAIDFDFTVIDIVKMGRHVYSSLFSSDQLDDVRKAEEAMRMTGVLHMKNRSVLSLSGGQRQLVFIAKALAQNTPILFLDEPISALDIRFQLSILSMLKRLANQGKTIIVVLHDLNLAARYCSKMLLLSEGRLKQFGTPEQVLSQRVVDATYDVTSDIRMNAVVDAVSVTAISTTEKGRIHIE